MKNILLTKVIALIKAFRAEGHEAEAVVRPATLYEHTMLIIIKGLTNQDVEQMRRENPEIRIIGG